MKKDLPKYSIVIFYEHDKYKNQLIQCCQVIIQKSQTEHAFPQNHIASIVLASNICTLG